MTNFLAPLACHKPKLDGFDQLLSLFLCPLTHCSELRSINSATSEKLLQSCDSNPGQLGAVATQAQTLCRSPPPNWWVTLALRTLPWATLSLFAQIEPLRLQPGPSSSKKTFSQPSLSMSEFSKPKVVFAFPSLIHFRAALKLLGVKSCHEVERYPLKFQVCAPNIKW